MNKFDSILNKSREIKDFRAFDVDAEWAEFQALVGILPDQKTHSDDQKIVKLEPKKSNRNILYFLSFAASMTLVVAALFLLRAPKKTRETIVTNNNLDTINLVDGSVIYLGKNSTLEFPTKFEGLTERKVSLKGDATFEVNKNPKLPFKVYNGDLYVEVLGTVFSIFKMDGIIEINNLEGSVKVAQVLNKDNFKILNKGDKFVYSNGIFKNTKDTVAVVPVMENPTTPEPKVKAKPEKPVEKTPAVVEKVEVKLSTYKLESVIKGHLLKFHKDKVKLGKKVKLDMDAKVKLDISKPYQEILEDLKKLGIISYSAGDCPDCFIISAPEVKN